MEEVVGSIPTRSTIFLYDIASQYKRRCRRGPSARVARSGFRLRAPASLTPAKRLKFDPDQVHHFFSTISRLSTSVGVEGVLWLALLAQDFACGLPLRSRPQNGSSSIPTRSTNLQT